MKLPVTSTPAPRSPLPAALQDESELLVFLGISAAELRKIWWYRYGMYHRFALKRRGRKPRIIEAPDKRLKHLQRKLLEILNPLYRPRNPVHGFVKNKSTKTNAESHLKKRYVLNLDIKEFFPSILEGRVAGALKSLGVEARVAKVIARICSYQGRLPQGAPTSPTISNIVCYSLDKQLMSFCKAHRFIYTRYADDITISSNQPMTAAFEGGTPVAGKIDVNILSQKLRAVFESNGFNINQTKAFYGDRDSRRTVTGIKINEILNLDRSYIRNIRAALFCVEKHGICSAQKQFEAKLNGKCGIESHLHGKLIWLRHIRGQSDPVFRALAVRFNRSFPEKKINILPSTDEIRNRANWIVEYFSGSKCYQGTAFFLKGVGLITAAHCVEGVTELDIYHPSKPSNIHKAIVKHFCAHRDLALLVHDIPDSAYFELERSEADVRVMDKVIALGYPSYGPGDNLNIRAGSVTSRKVRSTVNLIEVDQSLAQGMSGGPVVDTNNRVVGVIHKGGPEETRDFAVPIEELYSWLSEVKKAKIDSEI